MQLLAKLLLVAPPIDLYGRLGLDALMCGATEVMSTQILRGPSCANNLQ